LAGVDGSDAIFGVSIFVDFKVAIGIDSVRLYLGFAKGTDGFGRRQLTEGQLFGRGHLEFMTDHSAGAEKNERTKSHRKKQLLQIHKRNYLSENLRSSRFEFDWQQAGMLKWLRVAGQLRKGKLPRRRRH